MASVINKLAAIFVSKLDKPGYYGDGGGLWLQVSPTKSKSWIFRFTIAGKQREMGLGSFNTVDMATARVKANPPNLSGRLVFPPTMSFNA